MATHNITLNEQGAPTPKKIMELIEPGDTLNFSVGSEPIILCMPNIFETERIEIDAGASIAVRVNPYASHGDFVYWSCPAADASGLTCSEIADKGKGDTGGGSVGGGGEE